MRCIYFILIVLLHHTALAQVYKGTIDKYPIVLEITDQYSYDFDARYYYTNVKKNLYLKADEKEKMVFHLVSPDMGKETFRLKREGKTLKGTWIKKDKKLNVTLTQVDTAKIKSNFKSPVLNTFKREELFAFMKLENIKFNKDSTVNFDGTEIDWYTEPLSGMSGFRIKSSGKIKNIEGVNRVLRDLHLQQVTSQLSCSNSFLNGGGYEAYTCTPVMITSQVISIYFSAGYYCGGVHPDFDSWGVAIDVTSLKTLALADVYNFGEDFGTTWRDIVKAHFPGKMGSGGEDDCDYNDTEVWGGYSWCLTNEGLWSGAYFARAMRACDTGLEWPVIPYKDLEKYRVNKSKYVLK